MACRWLNPSCLDWLQQRSTSQGFSCGHHPQHQDFLLLHIPSMVLPSRILETIFWLRPTRHEQQKNLLIITGVLSQPSLHTLHILLIFCPNIPTLIYPNTSSAVWLDFAFVSIPWKSSRPHGMTLFPLLVIYVMLNVMYRMNNTFFSNALIPVFVLFGLNMLPCFLVLSSLYLTLPIAWLPAYLALTMYNVVISLLS
eukprot:1159780-Pelagomonas_calceolata.AAC.6